MLTVVREKGRKQGWGVGVSLVATSCILATTFLLSGCGNSSAKFRQYYVQGEKLYLKHCSNCHQNDGTGLGRVYPPLSGSDFMKNNFEEVICLMRYGISGELIVNGQQFDKPMQGISTLTDLEIAEITTYIYNTWGHEKGIIEVRQVSAILNTCQP